MNNTPYCSLHRGHGESESSFITLLWQMLDLIRSITGRNVTARLRSDDSNRNTDYAEFFLKEKINDAGEIQPNQPEIQIAGTQVSQMHDQTPSPS